MKKNLIYLFAFLSAPSFAWAKVLETPNYSITIKSECEEGVVVCDQISYTGVSKNSGKIIHLKGSDWHTLCSDGVTPCTHLGYQFKNGNVTYYLEDKGVLELVQGKNKVLVHEEGEWKD